MTKSRSSVPQMRGVSAFLSHPAQPVEAPAPTDSISISKIRLPANQPRRYFDPAKLQKLADSVRQHGILESLLVRPLPQDDYELVAGERRYRAAQIVGLETVPVTIRELSDQEALQLALIENLQREDLNPIEETEGVLDLLTLRVGCSQAEIAEALTQMATAQKKGVDLSGNVSRQVELITDTLNSTIGLTPESFRTARLPLLKLPSDVLDSLREGKLEYTKARAIARVEDDLKRRDLLQSAIDQSWSLTQIKQQIKELATSPDPKQPTISDRLVLVSRKLKKTLDDAKKQKRLEKLLQELESLVDQE
jgi:ParB family transcriptional regulator, chromosome partitioning protein